MHIYFSPKQLQSILDELRELLNWQLTSETIADWLSIYSIASAKIKDLNLDYDLLQVKGIDLDNHSEYESFYSEVFPEFNKLDSRLTQKYVNEFSSTNRYPDLNTQFQRKSLTQNIHIIDLQLREKELINQFYDLSGSLSINYDGKKNIAEIVKTVTKSPSRKEREHVYRLFKAAQFDIAASIDKVFVELIKIRQEKAGLLGMNSYLEFAWVLREREYLPDQSIRWTRDIIKVFNPLHEKVCEKIAAMHSVEKLAPWDLLPDISIGQQLTENDYKNILVKAFDSISPEFGEFISKLSKADSFDIMSSNKNSATNFAYTYASIKKIGIHGNATGGIPEFRNLMHECGHAIHESYAFENEFLWQKRASGEVAELIAYIFQFLASDYLKSSGFLNKELWSHYQLFVAKFILRVFWEDSGDEQLQQWIYQQKTIPSPDEIDTKYLSVFSTPLNLDRELQRLQSKNWQTYHVIAEPFYSFDYSIALIGTLLCIEEIRRDKTTFVENLVKVMKQGSTVGISDALTTLGVRFPFHIEDIEMASKVLLNEFLT